MEGLEDSLDMDSRDLCEPGRSHISCHNQLQVDWLKDLNVSRGAFRLQGGPESKAELKVQ